MRIESIDILRGIAILGILFMNIYHLGAIEIGYSPFATPPLSDQMINIVNGLVIEGRFRSLFCLLFGVGLAVQFRHIKRQQKDPFNLIKSRLNWLLIFGLIHGVFIFAGDILLSYAIAGFLVYRHVDKSAAELFSLSVKFLAVGLVSLLALSVFESDSIVRYSDIYYAHYDAWYSSYVNQLINQVAFVAVMAMLNPLCLMWYVGGVMLLGMALYKANFFRTGLNRKLLIVCLAVTIIVSAIDLVFRLNMPSQLSQLPFALASISGITGAIIYCHFVIILIRNPLFKLTLLKQVGKLAFSFYIFQSICMGLWLRWWNPEFNLHATRLDYLFLVIVACIVQLFIAHYYFRFFKQGPLEWLWRRLYK